MKWQPHRHARLASVAIEILEATTPNETKDLGKIQEHHNWDDGYKLAIMKDILQLKWNICPIFRKELLDRGSDYLEHDTGPCRNNFWGVVNGQGDNNFGKLLMSLRTAKCNKPPPAQPPEDTNKDFLWIMSDSMAQGKKERWEVQIIYSLDRIQTFIELFAVLESGVRTYRRGSLLPRCL